MKKKFTNGMNNVQNMTLVGIKALSYVPVTDEERREYADHMEIENQMSRYDRECGDVVVRHISELYA